MNELLIAVLAVFLLCMIVGYVKGFTRLVISLASMVLTIFLVNMAVPYVSRAIVTLTPLDEKIKQSCIEAILPEEMRTGKSLRKTRAARLKMQLCRKYSRKCCWRTIARKSTICSESQNSQIILLPALRSLS